MAKKAIVDIEFTDTTFWLARERDDDRHSYYVADIHRLRWRKDKRQLYPSKTCDCFCPKLFETITGVRLRPGAGPIKVKLVRVE